MCFGVFNFIFIFTKTATKMQGKKRDHHFVSYAAGVIDPGSSVLAGGDSSLPFFLRTRVETTQLKI